MLLGMDQKFTQRAAPVRTAGRSSARTTGWEGAPTSAPTGRDSGALARPVLGGGPDARQSGEARAERPARPAHAFGSVICANDRTATDDLARRQAARLVSPEGVVELVAASRLTRRGKRALHDRCDGYDLLALGACAEACTAAANAPIPTLIGRPCPPGTEVTDTIVVAVPPCSAASRPASSAARLDSGESSTATTMVSVTSIPGAHRRAIRGTVRLAPLRPPLFAHSDSGAGAPPGPLLLVRSGRPHRCAGDARLHADGVAPNPRRTTPRRTRGHQSPQPRQRRFERAHAPHTRRDFKQWIKRKWRRRPTT
jgi:hypothetical protein